MVRPVCVVDVIWPTLGFATPEARAARAELVIGEIKAWMIDEIRGIHANLEVRRFPLRNVEGLTDR